MFNILPDSLITNVRSVRTNESTLGVFYIDSTPIGFVIEDEKRIVKVNGETRIKQGVYKLKLRKQLTPLTKRYRAKFDWFTWHIELDSVEGFTGIYIHIGNRETDTAGCQVIGYDATTSKGEFENKFSTNLFKDFYMQVVPLLEAGHEIKYRIIDNDIQI